MITGDWHLSSAKVRRGKVDSFGNTYKDGSLGIDEGKISFKLNKRGNRLKLYLNLDYNDTISKDDVIIGSAKVPKRISRQITNEIGTIHATGDFCMKKRGKFELISPISETDLSGISDGTLGTIKQGFKGAIKGRLLKRFRSDEGYSKLTNILGIATFPEMPSIFSDQEYTCGYIEETSKSSSYLNF